MESALIKIQSVCEECEHTKMHLLSSGFMDTILDKFMPALCDASRNKGYFRPTLILQLIRLILMTCVFCFNFPRVKFICTWILCLNIFLLFRRII